jgi:predicted amidohydrolase
VNQIFKAAAIQMDCVPYDVEKNLLSAERLLQQAADKGVVFAVVPELFDTGYRVEDQDTQLANPIPGPVTDRLSVLCQKNRMYIAGAHIERSGEHLYDTAFLLGPDGLIGTYRKTNLWGGEVHRFKKGDEYKVFDIGYCKVGLQICYDIGFPEGARILTLMGADIVAYTSAFGKPRLYAWDLASRSRALENGNFVIACNRYGIEKEHTEFAGHSRVVGPRGNVLASAKKSNDVVVAEINLEHIKDQRSALPYLKDLRRESVAEYYRI